MKGVPCFDRAVLQNPFGIFCGGWQKPLCELVKRLGFCLHKGKQPFCTAKLEYSISIFILPHSLSAELQAARIYTRCAHPCGTGNETSETLDSQDSVYGLYRNNPPVFP